MKQKVLQYTVVLDPAEEGGYVVSVPSLPGCQTQGETFEEALAMAKDAIEGYLGVLKDTGEEIPKEKPSSVVTRVSVNDPLYQAV